MKKRTFIISIICIAAVLLLALLLLLKGKSKTEMPVVSIEQNTAAEKILEEKPIIENPVEEEVTTAEPAEEIKAEEEKPVEKPVPAEPVKETKIEKPEPVEEKKEPEVNPVEEKPAEEIVEEKAEETVPEEPVHVHTFGGYRPNNDATIFEDGTKTRRCFDCDYTETIPNPGSKKPFAYYNEPEIDMVYQEINNCTYLVKDYSVQNVRVDEKNYAAGQAKVFNIVHLKNKVNIQKGDMVFVQGTLKLPKSIKARNSFLCSNARNYGRYFDSLWNENGLGTTLNYRNYYIAESPETLNQFIIIFDQFTDGKGEPNLTADLSDFDVIIIKKENLDKVFPVLYTSSGSHALTKVYDNDYCTSKVTVNKDSDLKAGTGLLLRMVFDAGADLGNTNQFYFSSECTTPEKKSAGYKDYAYGVLKTDLDVGTVTTLKKDYARNKATVKAGFYQKSGKTSSFKAVDINTFEVRLIPEL